MEENLVKFIYGTQDAYDAITTYDENALYFLTDTNKLYKGSTLIANYVNERVIAAALVDLHNQLDNIDILDQIEPLIRRVADVSAYAIDVSSNVADLRDIVTDVSSNVADLDEIFAAVANDLNTKIISIEDNIDTYHTEVSQLDELLALTATDLDLRILDISAGFVNLVNRVDTAITNSSVIQDLSTGLYELDYILANSTTQLNTRVTDISTVTTENAQQLTWIVINN